METREDASPLAAHSGNGKLRGGGVRKIYGKQMTIVQLMQKIQFRLGVTLIICLAINVTLFAMYLTMHTRVHDILADDISIIKRELESEMLTTDIAEFTDDADHTRSERSANGDNNKPEELIPDGLFSSVPSTITMSSTTGNSMESHSAEETTETVIYSETTSTMITTTDASTLMLGMESDVTSSADVNELSGTSSTTEQSTSTTASRTTSFSTSFSKIISSTIADLEDIDPKTTTLAISDEFQSVGTSTEEDEVITEHYSLKLLEYDELAEYESILHKTYTILTTFTVINFVLLILLIIIFYLHYIHPFDRQSNTVKVVYKAMLIATLIFFFIEISYLLHPLLYCSIKLPEIVDRLFETDVWPQSHDYMQKVQEHFVCTFDVESLKNVYMRACDSCVPKLKDMLLRTYVVVLLILVALLPLLLIAITWFWNSYMKDGETVKQLRHRLSIRKNNITDAILSDSNAVNV